MAIEKGLLDSDISFRIRDANDLLYKRFLDEIEIVFRYPVKAVV
jgi:hypothetical protein